MSVKQLARTNSAILAVLAVGVALTALFLSRPVGAETRVNNSVNVLKVSPVRSDIELKPGQTKNVQVIVTNLTNAPIAVRPIENDFIAGDERGTPALILDADKYAPTHSLKRFMLPLQDIVIPAKQGRAVLVTIKVPVGAQAGGYFGALRFAPKATEDGGQVNMNASVASLLLLRVPGDIIEELELTNFSIKQDGKEGSFFNTPKKLEAAFRFQNDGNVQVGPFGSLAVKRGNDVVYETKFNEQSPRGMVLPDSARRWEIPLKNIDAVGHYTVSATFTYGETNKTIEVVKSFWVVPMWMIIVTIASIVVLLLLIVGIVWLILRRRKRRKMHGRHSRRVRFNR